jgi:branched-chain amino acid aminotransferase
MPITTTEKIWMDGELVDWDNAQIHILTHTLHYGCGVFEGIRAYPTESGPGVFRLTDHITRLFNSAKIFMIDVPFSAEEIIEATKATVRVNGLDECYIRPIVYLGYGEMGLNPLPCPVNVSIAVWPWGAYLGDEGIANGVRMKISSWQRHDPNAMPPAAKGTGMYINSSMAKIEAIKAGYDEAVLLSPQGYVSECTGENIFVVKGGRIITPPTSAGALEGITQNSIMTIARDLDFDIEVGNLLRSDLYTADEAFCSGTAAEIVPISSVDDRLVGSDGRPGPITRRIQEVFHGAVRGQVDRYKDWLEHVG